MKWKAFVTAGMVLMGAVALNAPQGHAALSEQQQIELERQKQAEDRKIAAALRKKKAIEAKLKAAEQAKKKAAKAEPARKRINTTRTADARKRECGSFAECLFGKRRTGTRTERSSFGRFQSASLSQRMTRRSVDWDETKYPVGSIVVNTPERALYYISGEGEAIRYRVGVGREGFQWSGNARITGKKEWPSWTPPQTMIEREAAKGIEIPEFMEGGPGNPLGARALYIGGTIYRVHGTNNESSIGGAVSSGCIRMMNADVIDLYKRVNVGSRIYVYQ
jgi:lipoprotein-anchoring transpeptidase ErfK/SrfK